MKVLFTVRREYFDAIVNGSKVYECRRATKRWRTISSRNPSEAVFLCGRQVHRREIIESWVASSFKALFGRNPSAQGIKDIGTGEIVVFSLGRPSP